MSPKGPCAQVGVSLLVVLREAETSGRWAPMEEWGGPWRGTGTLALPPCQLQWGEWSPLPWRHELLPGHVATGPKQWAQVTVDWNLLNHQWTDPLFKLFSGISCYSDRKLTKIGRRGFADLPSYDIQNLYFSTKSREYVKNSSHKSRMKEINFKNKQTISKVSATQMWRTGFGSLAPTQTLEAVAHICEEPTVSGRLQ